MYKPSSRQLMCKHQGAVGAKAGKQKKYYSGPANNLDP